MLYQKILTGEAPYHVKVGDLGRFGEHRHADIEFNYCIEGKFDIVIDKTAYCIQSGELALINPMVSHCIPENSNCKKRVLTVTPGASFLKKHFAQFSQNQFQTTVCKLSESVKEHQKLKALLEEVAGLCDEQNDAAELMLAGDLYKICAHLLTQFAGVGEKQESDKNFQMVEKIEKALELIYYHYNEPLTVDDAARITGYGKSNFCKIFKTVVGDTFHNLLNRQRIECACGFLSETAMSVSEIAHEVGFSETKTFCRVFRAVLNMTPGEYREKGKPTEKVY